MNYYWTITPSQASHEYANKFARQQASEEKARQVYRNTLAVCAVNEFVQEELGYTTDLKAGDCWNPVVRMVHDVADLIIPELGILECRSIKAEDEVVSLPNEVRENRIAYVAVQFEEQSDKIKLRGFVAASELGDLPEEIKVNQLQEIEEMIDYLFQMEMKSSAIEEIAQQELKLAEESVREILKDKSIAEIVAQLEEVYRNYDPSDWWDKAGKALAGSFAGAGGNVGEASLKANVRESGDTEEVEIELRDFAEDLLEKLAEIWGDAA